MCEYNHQLLKAQCLQMFVFQAPVLLLCLCLTIGEPQNNFNRNRNNRRPARQNNNNRGQFLRNGVTRNGSRDRRGTEVYPGCDGKVCLPEANLCAERQDKVSFFLLILRDKTRDVTRQECLNSNFKEMNHLSKVLSTLKDECQTVNAVKRI